MLVNDKTYVSVTGYWISVLIAFLSVIAVTVLLTSGGVCTYSEFNDDTRAAIAQREAIITSGRTAARERDSLHALLR